MLFLFIVVWRFLLNRFWRFLLSPIWSFLPGANKDIYNIQAKAAGKSFKNGDNATELIEALNRHRDSVELSVRDIVAFLNKIQRKNLLKTP